MTGLSNGLLMAPTMHELTALLLALRLDCRQVALWLGDRLPMDVAGYQWVIGTGPTDLRPILRRITCSGSLANLSIEIG